MLKLLKFDELNLKYSLVRLLASELDITDLSFLGADLAVSTEIGDADETVEEKGGPSPPLEELCR